MAARCSDYPKLQGHSFDGLKLRQLAGIVQTGANLVGRQIGKLRDNFICIFARGEVTQYEVCRNAGAF